MSKQRLYQLAFMFVLLVCSCTPPQYLEEKELMAYARNNPEFSRSVSRGEIEIQLAYQPTDLLVARELRAHTNPNPEQIVNARKKYQDHYYFQLSISRNGKEILDPSMISSVPYAELVKIVSFRMGEFFNIVTSEGDTFEMTDYILERTYGMSTATELLLVIEKKGMDKASSFTMVMNEFGLGTGSVEWSFDVAALNTAPKIFNEQQI